MEQVTSTITTVFKNELEQLLTTYPITSAPPHKKSNFTTYYVKS